MKTIKQISNLLRTVQFTVISAYKNFNEEQYLSETKLLNIEEMIIKRGK